MKHSLSAHLADNEKILMLLTVSIRTRSFGVAAGGVFCFIIWLGMSYYALGILYQPVIAISGTLAVAVLYTYILLYNFAYLPRAYNYAITNRRVISQRGILGNVFISVSYEQITDIVLEQTFAERFLFNSGTLHLNTSGSASVELSMTGIDDPVEVKRFISNLMSQAA
ncbi:MAG: Bacterial membrane flanked domain protein [candidate division WS6 bacterium OLB20]|uniref:Bacterial membrane flanked domain protein n=1 Tax=candidate division WS6 bacterium OLB20 TaxID=1617426 RepID=A0A136LWP3_9BACT|nr:MAG: Bacterial membrane flanked domain protein [candidate division WS6 bacterium OLB20]